MKILTICPSINREDQLTKMLESFNDTRSISEIIICREKESITNIFNRIYKENPDYAYYHLTNDDVIYHTPSWDIKLTNVLEAYGYGISYGNDLFQGRNLPTFPMISREIIEATGWLQYPKLERYYGDSIWKIIGEDCGCLYYKPEVIIEHNHYYAGKSMEKPNEEIEKKDKQIFAEFLSLSPIYINKVRNIL